MSYLPVTPREMKSMGWGRPDFVLVSGDVYVDHPAFGIAIIARVLEHAGFRVAVMVQPDLGDPLSVTRFGQPKLGFLVSGGSIDSMVAHYTVNKKIRRDDPMSLGNKAGARPDRAVIAYCRALRARYRRVPIIIGGLEASLRRFAHYDYWDDAVRPSILTDSGADLLVYGMGERAITTIAQRLRDGEKLRELTDIAGTSYSVKGDAPLMEHGLLCPSLAEVSSDTTAYCRAAALQWREHDHIRGHILIQSQGERTVIQNPPAAPLETAELDALYELPFTYRCHPVFEKQGGVKGLDEVVFSITHNRGCAGACNFCSIAIHQGRAVRARSHQSVLAEAARMTADPRFKGSLHDVGGPTANLRGPLCDRQLKHGVCADRRCLYPQPCSALKPQTDDYLRLLRELRELPGVRRVFVRSGLRHDLILAEHHDTFIDELTRYHVSGQLRLAPEHSVPHVLATMGKPPAALYDTFCDKFYRATKKAGKEQYVLPYLISSHPGCTLKDAVALMEWLKARRCRPEQVQDFYPTPGTIATAMFYTGLDPFTLKPVYVPRSDREKRMQRALLQYWKPDNLPLVEQALQQVGRPKPEKAPGPKRPSVRSETRGKQSRGKKSGAQVKKRTVK